MTAENIWNLYAVMIAVVLVALFVFTAIFFSNEAFPDDYGVMTPGIKIILALIMALMVGYVVLTPPPATRRYTPVVTPIVIQIIASPTQTTVPELICDESLWKHVYRPARLEILQRCATVIGKVDKVTREQDGDVHIRLRLDKEYTQLLNQFNQGTLVVEFICVGKVTQEDAVSACKDYTNVIAIPATGSRLQVIGALVLDREHRWNEIHPVTRIETLDQK